VVFDGSASRDGSGRPLDKLVWQQITTTDIVLSAAVDKANKENSDKGAPRLTIPGALLGQINKGSYTIRLTATNYLGVSGFQEVTFTKAARGSAPVVSVLGGPAQSFQIAKGISVSSALLAASVCPGSVVSVPSVQQLGAYWSESRFLPAHLETAISVLQ